MGKTLKKSKKKKRSDKVVNKIPQKLRPLVFGLGFGVVGMVIVLAARAATATQSFEAESGSRSGVSLVTDATASGGQAIRFGTASSTNIRYAGHVPGRVLLGMAASKSIRPRYDEAQTIIGQTYERRLFEPEWVSANAINSMLNSCDSANQYCVISFKAPNNDWAAVAAGTYDDDLDDVMDVARSRAKPFAFGIHHEPQGDGAAADWAAMQEHLVEYLAPVNDKMAFTTIANGFWWGPNQGNGDEYIATYYPQSLINKMNQYKGIIAADFYDAKPRANGTFASNADRTSMKLQGFVDWARAKGVNNLGVGEFGTATGPELTASWNVINSNKDLMGYANYFNSLANSDFDWRLIPSNYPIYAPENELDQGGSAESQARLDAFKAALIESSTP